MSDHEARICERFQVLANKHFKRAASGGPSSPFHLAAFHAYIYAARPLVNSAPIDECLAVGAKYFKRPQDVEKWQREAKREAEKVA